MAAMNNNANVARAHPFGVKMTDRYQNRKVSVKSMFSNRSNLKETRSKDNDDNVSIKSAATGRRLMGRDIV